MQKILVVEDNDLNMKLVCDILTALGYDTLQTQEGKKARALAREEKPDLILMDIRLPEVSGLELTRQIKEDENLKHIPVIAITAFAMKGDKEEMLAGGCDDYISKPISVENFIETVKKYAR